MDQKVLDTLTSLMQLDIDAVQAYTQAIERIEHRSVRDRLTTFRRDHERHITDLARCISRLGGKPLEHKADLKGVLIQGFTALRSMTGTEGALKAMKGNEETTNKHYRQALAVSFPSDVEAVVERNYGDEKRHLAYIEECLAERVWEQAA